MNFQSNFNRTNLVRKVMTLLCLALLLFAGWQWLNSRQNNDLSFLLPIYQNGEAIQPSAIISEDGQVLLPVRAIAENNGWLSQTEQLKNKAEENGGESCCGTLLLLKSTPPAAPEEPQAAAISWLIAGSEQTGAAQPTALGVWLTSQSGGQLLSLSAPGRFYQNELYLPEDFFAAAFGLSLKLDEQGRANLLRPDDLAGSAPQA